MYDTNESKEILFRLSLLSVLFLTISNNTQSIKLITKLYLKFKSSYLNLFNNIELSKKSNFHYLNKLGVHHLHFVIKV